MSEFDKIAARLSVQTPAPGDMPALWDLTWDEYKYLRNVWHGGE